LTATILNQFIHQILVYAPEKIDGKRTQRIEIIDLPHQSGYLEC